ncbi:PD-(D/E)XK nuclease family protein [Paenibacillus glucanolyticus]|jgi:hypothetical protein|nr:MULTISPECIES: PD-(D/E)XK nuclease family protein [Paenibacillus]KZS44764.1 hypothetical protein AWU65_01875 [Paenibacillus glucanolyticus]MDH6675643.1 hypothetical protein [Paenibacillus sp. LBL]OMF64755.1 hypothetical protein BK142_31710 [Paenibacillus glucanolyticus]
MAEPSKQREEGSGIDKLSILEDSPLFNLSLSSKELFHSNMIVWLFQQYPILGAEILSHWIGDDESNYSLERITREEKNRDIVAYFRSDTGIERTLIIENKVKSHPNRSQLERYSDNAAKNDYFLLLSLSIPKYIKGASFQLNNGVTWSFLSYEELANQLETLVEKIKKLNFYHAQILGDYVQFIRQLHHISYLATVDIVNDTYNWYSTKHPLVSQLRKLRIHDLYLKHIHAYLADELEVTMKSRVPSLPHTSETDWKVTPAGHFFTNSGFTKGTGLSEIKYAVGLLRGNVIIIGVQFQGDQFRLFIECESGANEIAEKLNAAGDWFRFNIGGITNNLEYPSKGTLFNKYGNTFRYRYVKINSNTSIKQIVDTAVEYIVHAYNNQSEIQVKLGLDPM